MQDQTQTRRKPDIRISESDCARLSTLAIKIAEHDPELSDALLIELERAKVVADGMIADDVIQMGSTLRFRPDTGKARTVTLVLPDEADISQGKISILTPIGAALIGLSTGQSMEWTDRNGVRHELSVLSVTRPSPAGSSDGIRDGAPHRNSGSSLSPALIRPGGA